jgi:hypothetical protein
MELMEGLSLMERLKMEIFSQPLSSPRPTLFPIPGE